MSETVVVPRDVLQVAIASLRAAAENTTSRNDRAAYNATAAMMEAAAPSPAECCVPSAGEPSFVLLGRDPQAPALVAQWAADREAAEPDSDKHAKAREIAARMVAWKDAHPEVGMARTALATPSPSALRAAQEAVGSEFLRGVVHGRKQGYAGAIECIRIFAEEAGETELPRTLAPAALSPQGVVLDTMPDIPPPDGETYPFYGANQMYAYGRVCMALAAVADEATVEKLARWLCREAHRYVNPDTVCADPDRTRTWPLWHEFSDKARAALAAAMGGQS